MYFYLVHHLLRIIPITKDSGDLKLNCTTLLIGTILHILTIGYLKSMKIMDENNLIGIIFNWYYYLIIADIAAVAILYKEYYGRSIISEMDKPEDWEWDEENNKYRKKNKIDKFEDKHEVSKDIDIDIDIDTDNISKNSQDKE